jgi:ribonuclease J
MESSVNIASQLGYLRIPPGCAVSDEDIEDLPPQSVTVLTTGAQGEPLSALARMATRGYKQLSVREGDLVIISATPIPGNDDLVYRTVNHLFRRGARVIYEPESGVHVSGHGSQEDLKLMLRLVRPRFVVPMHGEYRHLVRYADLAESVGMKRENVFLLEAGQVLEVTRAGASVIGAVAAGSVLIDGLGVGDVGSVVLRDRRHMAEDGVLIVTLTIDQKTGDLLAGPDIVSRGFTYGPEGEQLLEEARDQVREAVLSLDPEDAAEWATVKSQVRSTVSAFVYERLRRRPLVLPVIMEV